MSSLRKMLEKALVEKESLREDVERLLDVIEKKNEELADKDKLVVKSNEKHLATAQKYSSVMNKNRRLKKSIETIKADEHKRIKRLKRKLRISNRICKDYYNDNKRLETEIVWMGTEIKMLKGMLDSRIVNYMIKLRRLIWEKLSRK